MSMSDERAGNFERSERLPSTSGNGILSGNGSEKKWS